MNEISLNMTTIEVRSEIKPLRLKWSKEMVYDLDSFNGFDEKLEKEILKSLRRENRLKSIKNIFQ